MCSFFKVEDAGLYTCLASSLAGEDGKNTWVRVQGETMCSYLKLHFVSSAASLNLMRLKIVLFGFCKLIYRR